MLYEQGFLSTDSHLRGDRHKSIIFLLSIYLLSTIIYGGLLSNSLNLAHWYIAQAACSKAQHSAAASQLLFHRVLLGLSEGIFLGLSLHVPRLAPSMEHSQKHKNIKTYVILT